MYVCARACARVRVCAYQAKTILEARVQAMGAELELLRAQAWALLTDLAPRPLG